MASTTNNSGISGELEDLGPDEKWDDESEEEYKVRMERKRILKEKLAIEKLREMPPCIG